MAETLKPNLASERLDEAAWAGIACLLDEYVKVEPRDDIVIAYTADSRMPAAWVGLALLERGKPANMLSMAPLRDPGFAERLAEQIPPRRDRDGRCVVFAFERDTMSHNEIFRSALRNYRPDQYQVVRAISSGRDLFAIGTTITPQALSALNTTLLERFRAVRRVAVTSPGGTCLDIGLDHDRFRWISNRGVPEPGKFLVIPAGEVATFPASISGRLVADFAINVNTLLDYDARLRRWPVTVEIEDGEARNVHCANATIQTYLDRCFARENGRKVGEIGFGTNPNVREPVFENSHLNERCPGVHIGFGQHNQTIEAAGYFCDIHVDLIAKGGLIDFGEGEAIDLATLKPSRLPHPPFVNSIDLFSDDPSDDCCGMLSAGLSSDVKPCPSP